MQSGALVYREQNSTFVAGQPTILALHDRGVTCAQLLPLTAMFGSHLRTVAVEAPLPLSPYSGRNHGGREWFLQSEAGDIEPTTFGDGLFQVEQFTLGVSAKHDRSERAPLLLLGIGQGGMLALTMACLWPEMVDGAVAIKACLPEIQGWSVPEGPMNGLPIMLVCDTEDTELSEDMVKRSGRELARRGAGVRLERTIGAENLSPSLAELIRDWLPQPFKDGAQNP